MHNDLVAQKLGFKDYKELLLYEDVCANALDYSEDEIEDDFDDPSMHFKHTKEEYTKFINEASLTSLFNKVKDLSEVDRLIQVYLYYHSLHVIFDTAAINNKKEYLKDLGVLPNLNPEEYIERHNQLKDIAILSVATMEYILNQASNRLNEKDLAIFNDSTSEAQKTLEEYEIKSFGI